KDIGSIGGGAGSIRLSFLKGCGKLRRREYRKNIALVNLLSGRHSKFGKAAARLRRDPNLGLMHDTRNRGRWGGCGGVAIDQYGAGPEDEHREQRHALADQATAHDQPPALSKTCRRVLQAWRKRR